VKLNGLVNTVVKVSAEVIGGEAANKQAAMMSQLERDVGVPKRQLPPGYVFLEFPRFLHDSSRSVY
jgi:hypothetical protein